MAERDSQINAALKSGIEQMKSHAHVMKRVGAAHEAINRHSALQQKHAGGKQKSGQKATRKPVSGK